jgi:hypothetical protein
MTDDQHLRHLQGNLVWTDDRSMNIEAGFDKVAVHDDKLMFISLVAFSQDFKAIRAALAAGLAFPTRLRNVTLKTRDGSIEPKDVWPSMSGYRIDSHRLGLGSIQAIFVCRQQGFLPSDSDDALWQELKHENFSAPLLRGWMPYIRDELELNSLLSGCNTLDRRCSVLSAASDDLDPLIESGPRACY